MVASKETAVCCVGRWESETLNVNYQQEVAKVKKPLFETIQRPVFQASVGFTLANS